MTLKARIRAIDRFVKGLKEDNIYTDINACCVMAGWDSLAGALTPLKGTAPTNSGFLDADLDRGIGLKGNGSTKYLNSNRAGNADGQNDRHVSVFLGDRGTAGGGARYIASGSSASYDTFINNLSAGSVISAVSNPSYDTVAYSGGGFLGSKRSISTSFDFRVGGTTTPFSRTSGTPNAENFGIFCRSIGDLAFSNARLSYYSIGSATDLALLEARVSTLMADLRAIEEAGFDRDAIGYLRAVEEADGAYLETSVKIAINNLVSGLKADNLWESMASTCLLCGPRTLAGALVPLRGDAPTSYGFVEGDFDRVGLTGDGTSYLDSNRLDTADPTNDRHIATYVTTAGTLGIRAYIESFDLTGGATITTATGLREADSPGNPATCSSQPVNPGTFPYDYISPSKQTGFYAASRNNSSNFNYRYNGTSGQIARTAASVANASTYYVFASGRYDTVVPYLTTNAKLAFYSIGSSVDLSKLDSHISSYVTAIGAAV